MTGLLGTCVWTHLSKLSKLYTYKGYILLFVNYTRLFLKNKNTCFQESFASKSYFE